VREGLSLTLLEYMAASKPVIASDVGGNREAIVDGVSGVIVPARDPQSLARAIDTVLSDAAAAHRMGVAARERFEELFTVNHMVVRTDALYGALMSPAVETN
jgi:glycosyltransferase involved in cell wall biosynthesis